MDRKKTIITAVIINAGVLGVLFIAALAGRDEGAPSSEPMALHSEPAPLFIEPAPLQKSEPLPLVQLPSEVPKAEEPVAHKLPPLAKETASSAEYVEIAVKKGDTLEKIARAHRTTAEEIIKLNQLPSSFLRIGQILKVPVVKTLATAPKLKPTAPIEKAAGPEYYTVKVGDNPWTIAMKHHRSVEELLKLNGLNEEKARKLKPGDRLRIR